MDELKKFNKIYPLLIDKYETFIPNSSGISIPEKINSIIQQLNRLGKLTNDVVDDWNKVMQWVMNDGLTEEVEKKIDSLFATGVFDPLVQEMVDEKSVEVDQKLEGFNTQLAQKPTHQDITNAVSPKADTSYVDAKFSNLGTLKVNGVYSTLSALQTAFPTGSTGVYIVSADGFWHYWNGTAWTKGLSFQSSGLSANIKKALEVNIMPHNADHVWLLEETMVDSGSIYLFSYTVAIRISDQVSKTYAWSTDIKTQINDTTRFVTSPSGARTDTLKLNNGEALCFNTETLQLQILPNVLTMKFPTYVLMALCWNGKLVKGTILENMTSHNKRRLDTAETNIQQIQSVIPPSIPQYVIDDVKAVNSELTYVQGENFKFNYLNDVHGSTEHYDYLSELMKYGQSEAMVLNGDLNYAAIETDLTATKDYLSEVTKRLRPIKEKVYVTRGNHDGINSTAFSDELFTNVLIRPFVKENLNPKGYYYEDFPERQIRMIFLNSSMDSESRSGFDQAQVDWFTNVLNSTLDGWSVITFSHHHLLSKYSTMPVPNRASSIVTAIHNFKANKPNCIHIGHWFGHVHYDLIDNVDGINYVVTTCSVIENGTPDVTITGLTKPTKTAGTDTEYAMDTVCIDQETRTVNLIRLGAGTNRSFTY